jgi:hypothetical protein
VVCKRELKPGAVGSEAARAGYEPNLPFFGRRRNRTAGQISSQSYKLYELTGERMEEEGKEI